MDRYRQALSIRPGKAYEQEMVLFQDLAVVKSGNFKNQLQMPRDDSIEHYEHCHEMSRMTTLQLCALPALDKRRLQSLDLALNGC